MPNFRRLKGSVWKPINWIPVVGGWTNPSEKYAKVKLGSAAPNNFRVENQKCLSCHHLGNFGRQFFSFLDPQSSWTLDLDFLSLLICLAKEIKNNVPFCIFGGALQNPKMTAGKTNTQSFGNRKGKLRKHALGSNLGKTQKKPKAKSFSYSRKKKVYPLCKWMEILCLFCLSFSSWIPCCFWGVYLIQGNNCIES